MIKSNKSFEHSHENTVDRIQNSYAFLRKYSVLLILGSFFIFSCGSMYEVGSSSNYSNNSNNSNSRLPSEPGKCYAKCLMQDVYETFEEELQVYTGTNYDQDGVEFTKIIFKPATSNWVKKRSPNCRSANPDDCLIWCKVDEPEISEEYYLVTDTSLVKEYKIENVSYREIVKEGGFTEWKEVVCEADITQSMYMNIQLALISKGYLKDTIPDGKIGRPTKEALVKYQKDNGLPVGSLDVETLDHLGVNY